MIREYRLELETAVARDSTKIVHSKNHGVDYFARLVELRQNVRVIVPSKDPNPNAIAPGYPPGVLGIVGKTLIEDEAAFCENVGEFPHFLKPGAPRVALGGGYGLVYPYLGVRDANHTIVASFLRMGPQHPKAMSSDENRLAFDIYPPGYPEWRLSRGMTKTHHLALSFFGRALSKEEVDAEAVRREYFAATVPQDPVEITLDPAYVPEHQAHRAGPPASALARDLPQARSQDRRHLAPRQGPLAAAGMMDWGEAISTNNEEDQGYEDAMEYYRSGSYPNYLKCMQQMLHNATVDVVDWDPDPLRMGGTPYHTAYHQDSVCVPSHMWTEGMFTYAFMTGDREARRAAVGLCEWALSYIKGKPQIVRVDGRETGWPMIALVAGYQATGEKRYLDGAFELFRFYQEKVAQFGELLNLEPPGTAYTLQGYGEYAGFEGMHKLWLATGNEAVRTFALARITHAIDAGHIGFHSHGRMMDLYALYAAFDMSKDPKWIDLAKRFCRWRSRGRIGTVISIGGSCTSSVCATSTA